MAVVRNAANTLRRGRIGETSYYVSGGQQIARQALNNSNYGESASRSQSQQSRRIMWANLVNFYKASASWMKKAYETKKVNQTDYNKFMQVNLASARVALTKAESVASACVVDEYVVSQGSLPSIKVDKVGGAWKTDLKIGNLIINPMQTNANLTQALIDNNANVREGMQLSFVSYQQYIDGTGIPHVLCRLYEMTLSLEDQTEVYNYLPEFCAANVNGSLGTSGDISLGGFAYILSELVGGQLRVSTQQLTLNNQQLINQYTSQKQYKSAIDSYGVTAQVVLSPESIVSQVPEEQPVYISYVTVAGKNYYTGDYIGAASTLKSKFVEFHMSSKEGVEFARMDAVDASGSVIYSVTGAETIADGWSVRDDSVTSSSIVAQLRIIDTNANVYAFALSTSSSNPEI